MAYTPIAQKENKQTEGSYTPLAEKARLAQNRAKLGVGPENHLLRRPTTFDFQQPERRQVAEDRSLGVRAGQLIRDIGLTKRVFGGKLFQKDVEVAPGVKAGFEDDPITAGEAIKKVTDASADVFIPAIKNHFETSGSIMGEGLAYAIDPNVREQFNAGHLDVLPTITDTTPADIAKNSIGAGIETAMYKMFPNVMKRNLATQAVSLRLATSGRVGGAIARGAIKTAGSGKGALAARTGLRAGIGAIDGMGFAISEGLAKGQSAEEIIDNMKSYGVPSAVITATLPALGPILKREVKLFKKAPKEVKDVVKAFDDVPARTADDIAPQAGRIADDVPARQAGEATPAGLADKAPAPVSEDIAPKTRTTKVPGEQLPVGEGQTKVSRLEARMKGTLDDISPEKAEEEGMATYQQMNKALQIRKAARYVEKTSDEDVLAILRGDKEAPKGILHNSIAMAAEEKASMAGNAKLSAKLASLRSTRAGQEIGILTERDPTNPISAMEEIIKARRARVKRKFKTTPTKAIKNETKALSKELQKQQLKISEATSILDDLAC